MDIFVHIQPIHSRLLYYELEQAKCLQVQIIQPGAALKTAKKVHTNQANMQIGISVHAHATKTTQHRQGSNE
jgi:hypothetical protein